MKDADLRQLQKLYQDYDLDELPAELLEHLPTNKLDVENAEHLMNLGYPQVAPVLSHLLMWLQDINWPVGAVLAPFLATVGAPILPYVREILQSDDELWKYWTLQQIVAQMQADDLAQLRPELLALSNTRDEEGVQELAIGLLALLDEPPN